ncbi:MAG: hypothetical protein CBE00_14030 [Planctomycetaceae bacterium TMED240]|nr:hypothetical protein [Rhodopirellula sp.]OUX03667.1 MAG: hypothetical protein CBE00_14030 [Planctomycetaceae bacterium TMED240]
MACRHQVNRRLKLFFTSVHVSAKAHALRFSMVARQGGMLKASGNSLAACFPFATDENPESV